jgi:gliding motility-associated-like protein
MNIKNFILFFLFTATFVTTKGQIIGPNLVPNPDFEIYDTCPTSVSQICMASPWNAAFFYLNNYYSRSSDYLNTCSSDTLIQKILLNKMPHSGYGCAAIILYAKSTGFTNYREYIEVKLKEKLSKKKKYCCNLYTVPSIYFNMAIENIGMFISKNYANSYNPVWTGFMLIDTIPQIKNNNGIITDTINWTKISGLYDSDGDEEYITIGNFNDDNHTNWVPLKPSFGAAYYLIDNVSVCECSFDINLGNDTSLCEGESILLNPNLPNASFTWQDSSHAASCEVKQPGTYWVRAYVAEYDITTSDTIIISATDEKICNPPLIIPNFITPNGDNINDNFQIGNANKYDISLQIFNRWGNLIYQTAHYTNDYNCKDCAGGVYYYLLTAKSLRNGKVKDYKGSLTVMK